MRTILDLLHPCQSDITKAKARQQRNYDAHTKPRQFSPGDTVWARNFQQGTHWIAGTIGATIGKVMCKVKIEGKDVIWRRHVNQLRTRLTSWPFTINSDSEPSQSDSASTTSHTVHSSQIN